MAIGLLVVAVPLYGFYYFVRGKLTIAWRRWMTKQFLHSYGTEGADAIK